MALIYGPDYPQNYGFGDVPADDKHLACALSAALSTLERFAGTALQPLAFAPKLDPLGVAPPQPVIPEVFEQLYRPSPQLAPPLPHLITATPYEQLYGPAPSQPAPRQPQLIPPTPYEQLYRPPAARLAPQPQQLISATGFEQL